MKVKIEIDKKAFNILRRAGTLGDLPRSKFDYAAEVGDGLKSSSIVAPALWIARNFPEAPVAVQDAEGEIEHAHPLAQLMKKPNKYYSGAALGFALSFDYTITGNAYIEIERNGQRAPVALYYQPSTIISAKGTSTELITHYEQQTERGTRRIEAEDIIHFTQGIDPRDQKSGFRSVQCLLREIFTDDEAAACTAAILRNMGFPGVIISPADESDEIGPQLRGRLKRYFRRMFRGDQRGEVMVATGRLKLDTLSVDFSKFNVDKLRQIPEERVCAVLGVPAAVVGFGTGLEQTKVGATMKELRELAYENVIIPMQRVFADTLTAKLLPEFETDDKHKVIYDISKVRVLQEDENRISERKQREYREGIITRAEARRAIGLETTEDDEVFRTAVNEIFVPANVPKSRLPGWIKTAVQVKTKSQEQRQQLFEQFKKDVDELTPIFEKELERQFEEMGEELARRWEEEQPKMAKSEPGELDRRIIEQLMTGFRLTIDFSTHYLRTAKKTVKTINTIFELGVMLDAAMEQAVIQAGEFRKHLLDIERQTRVAIYEAVATARDEGLGPPAIARRIREMVSAGPWRSAKYRAGLIARAETKYAQNVSSMSAYRQAESVTHIMIFDAEKNEPHHPRCLELAGQIVTVEEASVIEPIQHPNCSRSFAPVVQ
mgnify:CR=1 FL=1